MARYVDEEHSTIEHEGRFIPTDELNTDYRKLVEDGVPVDPYVPPPVEVVPLAAQVSLSSLVDLLLAKGVISESDLNP